MKCLLHTMSDVFLLDCRLARFIAICLLVISLPILLILIFLPAWYGRYTQNYKYYLGSLSARAAWILQECPSFIIPCAFLLFNLGTVKENIPTIVCLLFYLFHYFYRYVHFLVFIEGLSFILGDFAVENGHLQRFS